MVGKKIEIAFWSSSASIKVQRFTIEIKMIKNFKILPYVSKDRHISSKKIWDFVMLQTDTTTFGDQFLKCCTVEFGMTKLLGGTATKIFSKILQLMLVTNQDRAQIKLFEFWQTEKLGCTRVDRFNPHSIWLPLVQCTLPYPKFMPNPTRQWFGGLKTTRGNFCLSRQINVMY